MAPDSSDCSRHGAPGPSALPSEFPARPPAGHFRSLQSRSAALAARPPIALAFNARCVRHELQSIFATVKNGLMIRISITPAAFEAICATLPLGSVGVEAEANERGERTVWLEAAMVDRLGAMRGPKESHSEVILRIAAKSA